MLRWLTAGESHGPALVAILEGLPAHVRVTTDDVADALARRRLLREAPTGRRAVLAAAQRRSNRSLSMTLTQAATKSRTNFSLLSSCA